MFEKLLKASDTLSVSVTKLLEKPGLPVGNELFEMKRIINKFSFILRRRKRTFKINKS